MHPSQPSLGGLGANSTAGLIRRLRDKGLEVPPGASPAHLRALLEDHEAEDHSSPPRRFPRQGWQLDNRLATQAHLPRSPSSPSRGLGLQRSAAELRGRLTDLGYEIPSPGL
ncbi:unnamed protein product, partial [Effrenium voratum]